MQAASMKQAGVLLLDAIYRSHPGSEDELLRAVADVCLASGLQIQSNSQLLLCPVSCCQIGAAVSQRKLTMTGKLQETLESAALKPNFQVIPGPLNQPAAVLPNLAGLISNKHKIPLVRGILANVQVSLIHPKTASDGSVVITVSKQQQPIQPDSSTKQPYEVSNTCQVMVSCTYPCNTAWC